MRKDWKMSIDYTGERTLTEKFESFVAFSKVLKDTFTANETEEFIHELLIFRVEFTHISILEEFNVEDISALSL